MLAIGDDAKIEFEGVSGTTVVRGWRITDVGGYLLTEKPSGKLPPFTPGKDAILRIMRDGSLYGVAVKYVDHLRKTNLCHLAFSQDLIVISLRKLERIPCVLPVTIRMETGDPAPYEGVITDLSQGGAKIISRAPIDADGGRIVTASFNPGGTGIISGARVKIVRSKSIRGRREHCGQFVGMAEHDAKRLESYINLCKTWTE